MLEEQKQIYMKNQVKARLKNCLSVCPQVGTVPQGVIDMNKCSDVHDAETTTTHQLSIAVKTPEKTTFIKGCDKHEIAR